MLQATTTTTEQKRKRRPYVGKEGTPLLAVGSGNGTAVLVQPRSRRDWANDSEHRALFPSHIYECPVCRRLFDVKVNPATGEHHNRREAAYCSDTCGNTARERRKAIRRGGTTTEDFANQTRYQATSWSGKLTVRQLLARLSQSFHVGVYWLPLSGGDWLNLQLYAPRIAAMLRFYEHQLDAMQGAEKAIQKHGRRRAEAVRTDLVNAILEWLDANPIQKETPQ